MKTGTWVGLCLVATTLIGGGVIYYLRTYQHYQRVEGVTEIAIAGERFPVARYQGLDGSVFALRLRGCFELEGGAAAVARARAATEPAADATPFAAPSWFECWDPEAIDAAVRSGAAVALSADFAGSGEFATERVVVLFPDGRGYQWRRLSPEP